ncbi:unnamed protein product, partial [Musa banksii]
MALIDRDLDTGRVIEHWSDVYAALHLKNLELRSVFDPEAMAVAEQRASALDEEVNHLKAELEESTSCIWTLDDELLTLSHDIESARSLAWTGKEVLKEERLALPEKIKGAIAKYKASIGFEHDLVRSGRVTYEFGYRVAYAHFRARYSDLELKSDPFADQLRIKTLTCQRASPLMTGPRLLQTKDLYSSFLLLWSGRILKLYHP